LVNNHERSIMIERYKKGLAVSGAALLAALGVGGVAAAQNAPSQAPKAPAATAPAQSPTAPETTTGPDTDTTQSGDQTAPDTGTGSESAAEAPGQESASETPGGDGPGGHADEPGNPNADTQAQGVQ
jgi:hypothetical protein